MIGQPCGPRTGESGPGARALIGLLLVLVGAAPAAAVEVSRVEWGFDGRVAPQRFNLLSVLVSHNAMQPFDGTLVLRRGRLGGSVDAPIHEPVYLAPNSSRWVQFTVFVIHPNWDMWTLSWGPGSRNQAELPQPGWGGKSRVALDDPDVFTAASSLLKRFPETLFPVQCTATDALETVLIDHAPRWNEAQQQSFLDWLTRGGRVHVVRQPNGQFPVFSGLLEELNREEPMRVLGAGVVFHHDRSRAEVDKSFVEQVIERRPPPDPAPADRGEIEKARENEGFNALHSEAFEFSELLLGRVKNMSRAEHAWGLIHLLALVYIALIFPGCYLLGLRRALDYRATFGALLATVVLFSLAFFLLGQRGHGESTSVHSVALARPLAGGRWDVTAWSNAFAVSGGDYLFTHQGTARAYSSGQADESVRGTIRNGADAAFSTNMPPFSSRTFLHRAVVEAEPLEAAIIDVNLTREERPLTVRAGLIDINTKRVEDVLTSLAIEKRRGLPPTSYRAMAAFGYNVYELEDRQDRYVLRGAPQSLAALLRLGDGVGLGVIRNPWSDEGLASEALFGEAFEILLTYALDVASPKEATEFLLPDRRVRLLVYADMPEQLKTTSAEFPNRVGRCLYCLDLFPFAAP